MEGENSAASGAELLSDRITQLVEAIKGTDPEELSRELFGENGDSLPTMIEVFPRVINAAVRLCGGFAEALESLPADSGAEMLAGSLSRVDGKKIGEAANSLSRVIIRFYESDPAFFNTVKLALTSDAVNAIDFGKLRKHLMYKARMHTEYNREVLAMMGKEPVALINLVNLLPEYVNNTVAVLNQLLDILTFPPEAMTYALFKVLEEINWDEVSGAVNGVSAFINTLRRGDLLLGNGSSDFTGVISSVGEDFTRNIDLNEVARAVSALSEYVEAGVTSLAREALGREGGALAISGALLSISNFVIRSTSASLEVAAALPAEAFEAMAGGMKERLDARELGTLVNSSLVFFNRFASGEPDLLGQVLEGALSSVDPREAEAAGKTLLTCLNDVFLAGTAEGEPLWPGVFATALNNSLASFNRLCSKDPQLMARRLDSFLADLDEEQFGEAAGRASYQVTEAALRNPGIARALARAVVSGAYRFMKGYARSFWTKRERGVR